jgi:GNAT superfamily N-acetyltransferase
MVEIRETQMGGKLRDFLNVVSDICRDCPEYIRPLDMDLSDRLTPGKNPFFEHGEGVVFTAYKSGKCVGRITAQIDHSHLSRYNDATGFFGFLDTFDDQEVASALLEHAEQWLRQKGMKRARGPISLNVNEELGCLVEGFDTPPYLMMPHHRPYQSKLIEGAGYQKAKDFFAWSYETGDLNARTKKAHDEFTKMPEVKVRTFDMDNLGRDVDIAVEIFNDAWSDNWGFVPLTRSEAQKMAKDFKLILVKDLTKMVEIDGEPAAMAVAVPNINDLVKDLDGKLFPTGLFKLLYRLKVVGPSSARLMLLGIRKKYRNVRKYAAMSVFLYGEMNNAGRRVGTTRGELSWTLEDNAPVNTGIKLVGGKKYKTYRVYDKSLEGAAS